VKNTNTGNPFEIVGSCTPQSAGSKSETWNAFCDANGNGEQDDDEESVSFVADKKCKKFKFKGASSLDCGDGDPVAVDCKCNIKPKDCPTCISECLVNEKKNMQMKFTCPDDSANAGDTITLKSNKGCKGIVKQKTGLNCDDSEPDPVCDCEMNPKDCPECDRTCVAGDGKKITMAFTCPADSANAGAEKILSSKKGCKGVIKQKTGLNCAGDDNGGDDCRCSEVVGKAAATFKNVSAKCVKDHKKSPLYVFFCDENGNGQVDDGEKSKEGQVKCKGSKVKGVINPKC